MSTVLSAFESIFVWKTVLTLTASACALESRRVVVVSISNAFWFDNNPHTSRILGSLCRGTGYEYNSLAHVSRQFEPGVTFWILVASIVYK